MIKVYVFITGLVLYQFAASPGGTSYAILVGGNYEIPYLGLSAQHEIVVFNGQAVKPAKVTLPLEARLTVKCPRGGCKQVAEPPEIHSLADIMHTDKVQPVIQPGCLAFDGGKNCRARGLAVAGRSGLLAFSGDWQYKARTDCDAGYPDPALVKFNRIKYVRAGRSWDLDYGPPQPVANTVLFTTMVDRIEDLKIDNKELKALLDPAAMKNCKTLGDFPKGAKGCAVVLIRNGSTDKYRGGGDLHFAPLYMVLENDLRPAEFWLPIDTDVRFDACTGVGAGDHLSHCTGARVPARGHRR